MEHRVEQRKIVFIGAGNMATAIIIGLVRNGYPARLLCACSPSSYRRDQLAQQYGIISSSDNLHHAREADVIVFAVKPQIMADVCQQLHQQIDLRRKLVLSIAAGITIARFYELLGENLNVIRIMPNTPVLIGQGMSGLFAPPQILPEDREFAADLMKRVGEICWVEQESAINAIIAVAGSAPAYFFLFMQAMQQQAEREGFEPGTARRLIVQSCAGAAAMAAANTEISLLALQEQVTSKGGTTAEALQVFEQHHLADIVAHAMQAAVARAREMETLF